MKYKQYIKEEKSKESLTRYLGEVVVAFLNNATIVHLCHFVTKSGFKHEVLGQLYKDLAEWADKLAEACIGNGYELTFPKKEYGYIGLDEDKDPIQLVIDMLHEENSMMHVPLTELTNEGIKAIITDIQANIQGYLYKLTNFHD